MIRKQNKPGTYVKSGLSPKKPRFLHSNNRQLQHHSSEPVATQLFSNAAHDQLVRDRADQECNEHGHGLREVCAGWEVDVSEEEVVDGEVPFAGEFEPGLLVSFGLFSS